MELQKTIFLYSIIFTIVSFIITLSLYSHFLNYIELRQGVVLSDPIINLFNPIDLTWLTFIIIYFTVILGIYFLIKKPHQLQLVLRAYIILIAFRMIALYLIPLSAPNSMIILADPFVEFFSGGTAFTKDLFFSGHTATVFLLYISAEKRWLKRLFLLAVIIVGVSVILQHVHYSIDVFASPFFSYVSYKIAKKITTQF